MTAFRLFVTNLTKYNDGELVGRWVDFPTTEEEFDKALDNIGALYGDEWFFTDFDSTLELNMCDWFCEHMSFDEANELAEEIADLDDFDLDLVRNASELVSLEEAVNHVDEIYFVSDVDDEEELGEYLVHEFWYDELNRMGALRDYIDYEKFGRDYTMEATGMFVDDGWIECRF